MKKRYHIAQWAILVTLGVALIVTGTACPPPPPACTTDADCDDGLFCNGAETCVDGDCLAGTNPCFVGDECVEENDSCVTPDLGDQYANMLAEFFPHEEHFAYGCDACHHDNPSATGLACTECHDRDEGLFSDEFEAFVPKLKEAMHTADGVDGKTGCRNCHTDATEDDFWDCSQCHLGLNDL